MKIIELTDREHTILTCLIGIEQIRRETENWQMDKKTDRFTDEEIERYTQNEEVLAELSVLKSKLAKCDK